MNCVALERCATFERNITAKMSSVPLCYATCGVAWASCYAAAGLARGAPAAAPVRGVQHLRPRGSPRAWWRAPEGLLRKEPLWPPSSRLGAAVFGAGAVAVWVFRSHLGFP